MQQPRDIAIVHLTDLHFPVNTFDAPAWIEPMAGALRRIRNDERLEILGLAVTGDVMNSPHLPALTRVKSFLEESAKALGIEHQQSVDWQRVWIVDGNHDYRKYGLFRRKCDGIEEGGKFKRLIRYSDPQNRFLILGLNSSKRGPIARGQVELSDLRLFQRSMETADASAFTYRIVLVHHHLLPLPYPPREFVRRRIKKILRAASDEAFKLLENAGLTTDFLLKGSVNLVLHGHEHKEFAASVNYHGPSGERHVMAVVGGPAARTGFQVIYFRRNGDVELVRYGFKEADYEAEAEIALWSYNDWKRLDWERQSRKNGYYEQAKHLFELSETGDAQQTTDVTDIVGGENTISRIPFISSAGDSKFGRVALHSVYDKEAEVEVPTSCLPPSGPGFSFSFKVSPEATRRRPHRGYEAVRISSNNFALTQEGMRLRTSEGEPPRSEHVNITHRNPVRRTVLTSWLRAFCLTRPVVGCSSVEECRGRARATLAQ